MGAPSRQKLWERMLEDKGTAMSAIRDRAMIGHLEHPKDGRTDGNLGSLLVLEAKLDNDGVIYGRAKILDTIPGKTLKVYCVEGVRWGFSSRGSGVIRADGTVDENDYRLETWDAVMRPSTPGAYAQQPKPVKVREGEEEIDESIPPLAKWEKHHEGGYKHESPKGTYFINKLGDEWKGKAGRGEVGDEVNRMHALSYRPKGSKSDPWNLGRHETPEKARAVAARHAKTGVAESEDIEDAPEAATLLEEITHIESELTEAFDSNLLNRFLGCFTQAKTLSEQRSSRLPPSRRCSAICSMVCNPSPRPSPTLKSASLNRLKGRWRK